MGAIDRAQEKINSYRDQLRDDPSKTATERKRLLNKHAHTQSAHLINLIQAASHMRNSTRDGYQQRINAEMQRKGTTDLLILSQTAQAINAAGLSNSAIYKMAKEDSDVARAVLLDPALKISLALSDTMKAQFRDLVTEHALGADHQSYLDENAKDAALQDIGQGLIAAGAEAHQKVKAIESLQAAEPAIGEPQ